MRNDKIKSLGTDKYKNQGEKKTLPSIPSDEI